MKLLHIGYFVQRPFKLTKENNMASPSFLSDLGFAGLLQFYVKTIQMHSNAGNNCISRESRGRWFPVRRLV